uniref:Uncharacterized protein n=1 Tax=Caenorhabditis japonica TaxID=281687 RepID=A0A8R1I4Y4_CAEJA
MQSLGQRYGAKRGGDVNIEEDERGELSIHVNYTRCTALLVLIEGAGWGVEKKVEEEEEKVRKRGSKIDGDEREEQRVNK